MKIEGFPNDGRVWRLKWFGDLEWGKTDRSLTQINLLFSPLSNKNDSRYVKESNIKELSNPVGISVGHFPFLCMGSAWKNGEPIINENIQEDENIFQILSPEVPEFIPFDVLIRENSYYINKEFGQTPCLYTNL